MLKGWFGPNDKPRNGTKIDFFYKDEANGVVGKIIGKHKVDWAKIDCWRPHHRADVLIRTAPRMTDHEHAKSCITDPNPFHDAPDVSYDKLGEVLARAYAQAATGKGKERHAREGERFEDQVIGDMAKRFGVGSLLAQAFKKSEESQRLPHERAVAELLGGIIYLAAAVIHMEKQHAKESRVS